MNRPTGYCAGEAEHHERHREGAEAHEDRAKRTVVGQAAADDVADRHAEAGDDEGDRARSRPAGPRPRSPSARCSCRRRRSRRSRSRRSAGRARPEVRKPPSSRDAVACGSPGCRGTTIQIATNGQGEDARHGEVGDAPAGLLAEQGDRGHADDVGDRQARRARRRRPRRACPAPSATRRRARRRRSRRRAAGPRRSARRPAVRSSAASADSDGADGEGADQRQQQPLARESGGEHRDGRRPDDDAGGVRRDHEPAWAIACWWRCGIQLGQQVGRDVGQQAHATNSVAPMPKPPSASASRARRMRAGDRRRASTGAGGGHGAWSRSESRAGGSGTNGQTRGSQFDSSTSSRSAPERSSRVMLKTAQTSSAR